MRPMRGARWRRPSLCSVVSGSCRKALRRRGIIARIARKGIESPKKLGRHRYVIERTLEWVSRFRRLARSYERMSRFSLMTRR
jgi:hypothetical protein